MGELLVRLSVRHDKDIVSFVHTDVQIRSPLIVKKIEKQDGYAQNAEHKLRKQELQKTVLLT